MKTRKLMALAMGLALLLTAGNCLADQSSGTADFQITLTAGCEIDTSGVGKDFGEYLVGSATTPVTSAGTVSITCTNGVNYDWGIDGGQSWELKTSNNRAVYDGSSNYIAYRILVNGSSMGDAGLNANSGGTYTDTTGTLPSWANWGGHGVVASDGNEDTYDLEALVFLGEATSAPSGTYTDTVNISVVWP